MESAESDDKKATRKGTAMIELLALPAWNCPPRSLDDWTSALAAQGQPARVSREDDETWLEISPLRLRGYVVLEGSRVEAINFELHDPGREEVMPLLEAAAQVLDWEIFPDDGEEDDLEQD